MKTTKKNMISPLGEPINIFAPGCAVRIMPDDFVAGGTLERAEPVGGGLVKITFSSGVQYLVDDSLQEQLDCLVGQHMTIGHVLGEWGCGALP